MARGPAGLRLSMVLDGYPPLQRPLPLDRSDEKRDRRLGIHRRAAGGHGLAASRCRCRRRRSNATRAGVGLDPASPPCGGALCSPWGVEEADGEDGVRTGKHLDNGAW
jgi:hypothetical protein